MFTSFQEAVDSTAEKLKAQGHFGYDHTTKTCLYCTPEGHRCGVGVHLRLEDSEAMGIGYDIPFRSLISEEVITESEFQEWFGIAGQSPEEVEHFWGDLQSLHDCYARKEVGNCHTLQEKLAENYSVSIDNLAATFRGLK